MQQTRSCFCYSPAHGAAIIGIAFFIGSTVVSLMLVGLVVEWNEVLQTIEHNNGNGSEEEDEGDCEAPKFQSDGDSTVMLSLTFKFSLTFLGKVSLTVE